MSAGVSGTPVDIVHTWSRAERYGWSIFPVHSVVNRFCTCGLRADSEHSSAGKHPRTRDGFKSATKSRGQWEEWYLAYAGDLSWGLATGAMSGGVLVIDVDGRHGGFDSLTKLRQEVGGLPETLQVTSGSGSPHYYFSLPPGVNVSSQINFRAGIDIKADGGYVVLPPATHSSGGRYLWENDRELAEAPQALINLITHKQSQKSVANGVIFGVPDSVLLNGMPEGRRDDAIYRACCRWFEFHKGDRTAVTVLAMAMSARCTPPFLDWQAKVDQAEKAYLRGLSTKTKDLEANGDRRIVLTRASSIAIRPVKWLWDERVALGVISLLGGREGIGKSTVAYDMVARLTKGELPGCFVGEPKSVIVCATEDSWSHTINPRLMAAGADLDKVYRVNVQVSDHLEVEISLPDDLDELGNLAIESGAAMLLLDPLLSRLDGKLDTHKDAEVRRALEPLAKMAERANIGVLGLIHVNKSSSVDPLNLLMASRAFAAMARAVLFAIADDDDESLRHLGQAKNNLGKTFELPTLDYRISTAQVAESADGPITTGKIDWIGESKRSIRDLLHAGNELLRGTNEKKEGPGSMLDEAKMWLEDFIIAGGGSVLSKDAKDFARREGISQSTLDRARAKLPILVSHTERTEDSPRRTIWSIYSGESHRQEQDDG